MTFSRWPYLVFDLLNATWLFCAIACLALSGAFALRTDAFSQADKAIGRMGAHHGRWIAAASLYFPTLLALGNLARFHIYYLTSMSGVSANLAWNVLHGHGLRTMVYGDHSYFASHFAFAVCLFSPLLLIWNSTGVLAAAHGFLLGTVPIALFALARRRSPAKSIAWLILLLSLAHPSFQELTGTVLEDSVFTVPFFVAAAYFLETDRTALGILFGVLMFSTREQVPFIAFGVGLYLFFRRLQTRRGAGAALMIASALIWLLELKAISHAQADCPCDWVCNASLWGYFGGLGGSLRGVLIHALTRPWDFVFALVLPPVKLLPVLRVLSHTAFLPLFSGAALLPALFVWLPNQLASPGTPYQGLRAYYSSFVLGPLLWAMLHGLIRIQKRCDAERWRKLVAVLLAFASWGFFTAPSFYSPDVHVLPKTWEASVPKALALIPPGASVWCDSYLLPHLAMRHYVKILPGHRDCAFEENLFLPDYVLMSGYWVELASPFSETLLRLLHERGYEPIFREADLMILANPKRGSAPGSDPERLILPPA